MARTPASDGRAGVGKSGSPAPRSITSSPAALRRFASCEMAIVAEVSRWCRLGERPDPGVMGGRIAPRSMVGNRGDDVTRLPLDGWNGTILPSDRPLTTEDRVTAADAKAALERGRPVVLVRPPAVEQVGDLWELLGPPSPGQRPEAGPAVLVVCPDDMGAAEWAAAAPGDRRIHAVTGLARTRRILKERPVDILAGAAKDLAALLERAALKLAAVAHVVLAWPEALVDGDGAAALDTVLGEARDAHRIVLSWNPALLGDFLERHARRALVLGTAPVNETGRPLPPVCRARFAIVPSPDRPPRGAPGCRALHRAPEPGGARRARPSRRGGKRARRLHCRGPIVLSSLDRDPHAPRARPRCRSRARSLRSTARAGGGAPHHRQRGCRARPARSAVRAVRSGAGRGGVAGITTRGGKRDAGDGSHGARRGRPRESLRRPGKERPRERQGSRRSLDSRSRCGERRHRADRSARKLQRRRGGGRGGGPGRARAHGDDDPRSTGARTARPRALTRRAGAVTSRCGQNLPNADGPPSGAARELRPRRLRAGLFPIIHGLLQLLAGAERGGDRRLDLNHAARLGITAHAGRALAGFEVPEAGDLDLRALLELCGDDPLVVEQGFDRPAGIGLRHLGPHGQCRGQLGFVHGVSL